MSANDTFEGWVGLDPSAAQGNMKWQSFTPKPFASTDVDIAISHCGICGSDLHTLRSGWGATPYPCVVGHEIVGRATRVGVGAQCAACLKPDCAFCADGLENHCPAGVTTPLKRHGCGPGKKVGIVGLGGLGHFGVLFAKALGADDVVVISRTAAKKKDAEAMGATGFVATEEDEDWATTGPWANKLDLIVSTVSSPKMPLMGYLGLLKFRGAFVQVGAPEDIMPGISAFPLIMKEVSISGSAIGAPREIEEMLQLAADGKIKPWVQVRPMKEANQAVVDFEEGKPRYRFVLENEQ
ncbi:putative alcohol dehydrogenase superfamily zinc-containing [Diplodia seriata]|uniref:alcohol dehydrogenase (NADP(+)) n=1 Tax=Diplodia seriata TaxID=420778 RepID=A0A0G2EE07_9PEZI|nr:putative alcohol dehydrogenase superfamily zinc-containing [Diplodia seriata]